MSNIVSVHIFDPIFSSPSEFLLVRKEASKINNKHTCAVVQQQNY
jgi:hypothetical protein